MGKGLKITVVIIAGLSALAAQLPAGPVLKYALGESFPKNATVAGTVWNGQIIGVDGFGPITYRTRPLRIFSAKPMAQMQTQMPGISISGSARPGKLSDLNFKGQVWTFSNVDPRLAGLRGDFEARIDSLEFDSKNINAGCLSASGTVTTNVLAANRAQWSWTGPDLSGPISCEAGALTVALSGQEAGQDVNLTFSALPEGQYETRAQVKTDNPQAQNVLSLFGFTASGQTFTLNDAGRWR